MGVEVRLLSTRRPVPLTTRHSFVPVAVADTHYLFPPSISPILSWISSGCRGSGQILAYLRRLDASASKSRIRQLALSVASIELANWASRQGIEHIHGHSCADTAHVLAMTHRAGGPSYSLTLHGDLEVYGTDHQAKMANAEFVFTVGSHLRKQILEQTLVSSDRVFTTCMGVDTAELAGLGQDRFHKAGLLHLITVARLHPRKGHLHALRAIQRGLQQGFDLRYTIAGEGPHRDIILSQIAELELQSRVTLTGTLGETEVYQLLSNADAFLLPSVGLGEAWPVSVMEAMGAGLPVIASVIRATPEMINSGEDGLLVAQGSDRELYKAIITLANDVDLRIRIGEAARRTARSRFDVGTTAATLYNAVVSSLKRAAETY